MLDAFHFGAGKIDILQIVHGLGDQLLQNHFFAESAGLGEWIQTGIDG